MRAEITPLQSDLTSVRIPSSKSLSHRALITAACCDGRSVIEDLVQNEDTEATMRCLSHLGAHFEEKDGKLFVQGFKNLDGYDGEVLDCGESGSTLRFLIPLASLSPRPVRFTGHGRLMERPLDVYADLYRERGLCFEQDGSILTVQGPLRGGDFRIRGDVSSQFITGLLLACPLMEEDSRLQIIEPYESKSYVGLSEDVLALAGIQFEDEGNLIRVKGRQSGLPIVYRVDGDDSQAAFFACLALMTGRPMLVRGMAKNSRQGDHAIVSILKDFGAEVTYEEDGYRFTADSIHGTTVDLKDCPDLGPVLFALATQAEGKTTFIHARRLRIKESDRIAAMEEELRKLGCVITSDDDNVFVEGGHPLKSDVTLDGHNDHRIVMALSVLACAGTGSVLIEGAQAIRKSYPGFFEDLSMAGAGVKRYDQ